MTISPLGACRRRTAELVLFRFCPPGPLARYVSTSHWANNCSSVSAVQSARPIPTSSRNRKGVNHGIHGIHGKKAEDQKQKGKVGRGPEVLLSIPLPSSFPCIPCIP